ncbi:hypothetical protein T12_10280, partial [Trichinella patagoniensis]
TTSKPERERGCGGVTSVIFRCGVHIFCHTKCRQSTARRNKMEMHKVRIVSLSPKGVSKQNGIVDVPGETDCREVTVNPVAVSSKYFCERHVSELEE